MTHYTISTIKQQTSIIKTAVYPTCFWRCRWYKGFSIRKQPPKLPLPLGGSAPPPNTWSTGTTRVFNANRMSITIVAMGLTPILTLSTPTVIITDMIISMIFHMTSMVRACFTH